MRTNMNDEKRVDTVVGLKNENTCVGGGVGGGFGKRY
jgi:hypothetical protein